MGGASQHGDETSTLPLDTQVYIDYALKHNPDAKASWPREFPADGFDLDTAVFPHEQDAETVSSSSPPMSLPAPGPPKTPIYAGRKRDCRGNFSEPATSTSSAHISLSAFKKGFAAPLTQLFQTTQAGDSSPLPLNGCQSDALSARASSDQKGEYELGGSSPSSPSLHLRSGLSTRSTRSRHTGASRRARSLEIMEDIAEGVLQKRDDKSRREKTSQNTPAANTSKQPCHVRKEDRNHTWLDTGPHRTPGRTDQDAIILSSDTKPGPMGKPLDTVSDDEDILQSPRENGSTTPFAIEQSPVLGLVQPGTPIDGVKITSNVSKVSVANSQGRPGDYEHELSKHHAARTNSHEDHSLKSSLSNDLPLHSRVHGGSASHAIPETSPATANEPGNSRTATGSLRKSSRCVNKRSKTEGGGLPPSSLYMKSSSTISPHQCAADLVSNRVRGSPSSSKTNCDPISTLQEGADHGDPSTAKHEPPAHKRFSFDKSYANQSSKSPTHSNNRDHEHFKTSPHGSLSSRQENAHTTSRASEVLAMARNSKDAGPECLDRAASPDSPADHTVPTLALHRVWACFKSSPRGPNFFPASCIRFDHLDPSNIVVRFDDGTEASVGKHLIRVLDIRKGDRVKWDQHGHRSFVYLVDDVGQPVSASPFGCDIHGHRKVSLAVRLSRKSTDSDDTRPVENVVADVSSLYLIPSLWSGYEDRSLENPDVQVKCLDATNASFSDADVGEHSPKLRHTGSGIKFGQLFEGMAFAASSSGSHKGDELKSQAVRVIRANGGLVLDNGFEELFADATSPHSEAPTEGTREADADPLRIRSTFKPLRFLALLADTHMRTEKYLQALALNIPCLSFQWALTSVAKGSLAPWMRFLLASGESALLGGAVRSRIIQGPLMDGRPSHALSDIISYRPEFLSGLKFTVLLGHGKAADDQRAVQFVLKALGASMVVCATDAAALNRMTGHFGQPDFVCVPSKAAARQLEGKYQIIDREQLVQCLILGEFLHS